MPSGPERFFFGKNFITARRSSTYENAVMKDGLNPGCLSAQFLRPACACVEGLLYESILRTPGSQTIPKSFRARSRLRAHPPKIGQGQTDTEGAIKERSSERRPCRKIEIYNCGDSNKTPLLIHSPYSTHRLVLEYPLPESIPDDSTKTMKRKEGRSAREFLRLPDPWPPL